MKCPKSLMEAAEKAAKIQNDCITTGDVDAFLTGVEWLYNHLCELSATHIMERQWQLSRVEP